MIEIEKNIYLGFCLIFSKAFEYGVETADADEDLVEDDEVEEALDELEEALDDDGDEVFI
jgi:hypothetical protein